MMDKNNLTEMMNTKIKASKIVMGPFPFFYEEKTIQEWWEELHLGKGKAAHWFVKICTPPYTIIGTILIPFLFLLQRKVKKYE